MSSLVPSMDAEIGLPAARLQLPKFLSDLIAGVTVGLVALPLAMAFAIASGLPPQAGTVLCDGNGIYDFRTWGVQDADWRTYRRVCGGGAGNYRQVRNRGTVHLHHVGRGSAGAAGANGMGAMVRYFPRPVVVGFTNGIAILIASTQIRDFFGLRMEHVPGDFFHRMRAIAENFHTLNWVATAANRAV